MRSELLGALALALQVTGWTSFISSKLTHHRGLTRAAEMTLLASLTGLGLVTTMGAFHQLSCSLTAGVGVTLLAVTIILHPHQVDPYAAMYPTEASTAR
jgi:hypothetical protein